MVTLPLRVRTGMPTSQMGSKLWMRTTNLSAHFGTRDRNIGHTDMLQSRSSQVSTALWSLPRRIQLSPHFRLRFAVDGQVHPPECPLQHRLFCHVRSGKATEHQRNMVGQEQIIGD